MLTVDRDVDRRDTFAGQCPPLDLQPAADRSGYSIAVDLRPVDDQLQR
jgi:hypothetical protein